MIYYDSCIIKVISIINLYEGDFTSIITYHINKLSNFVFLYNCSFVVPHVWLSLSCIYACKYRHLIQLVKQYGVRKWSYIAQMLPGRIGKQCRERWHNHLRPDIKVLLISSSLILYYSIFTPTCFYGIH